MKKIISLIILVLSPTLSYSDIQWRDYMSTPNHQSANGPCATYAAVHCLEALYNYYYELGSDKVELDIDYAVEHFGSYGGVSYEGNVLDVFENIKNNWEDYGEGDVLTIGIPSVSGINSFPNYDHAYYSLKGKDICATKNAIEYRVKNYGPVCINKRWATDLDDSTLDVFEEYTGGYPIDYTQYGNANHWVVVVGVGTDPCPYFECLSSFPTGDDYYFRFKIT